MRINLHSFLKFGFFKFNDSGHRFEKLKGFFFKKMLIIFFIFLLDYSNHIIWALDLVEYFSMNPFFVEDALLQHVDQKPLFIFTPLI